VKKKLLLTNPHGLGHLVPVQDVVERDNALASHVFCHVRAERLAVDWPLAVGLTPSGVEGEVGVDGGARPKFGVLGQRVAAKDLRI